MKKNIYRHKPKYDVGDIVYHIGADEYYLIENVTVDMFDQEWYHTRRLGKNNTQTLSCYSFDNGTVKAA